jgi:hypothetical protein
MPRWVRLGVPLLLVVVVVGAAALGTLHFDSPFATSGPSRGPNDSGAANVPTIPPTPTPRPGEGGTALYGYLPYWQMSEGVAAYLDEVPLTTLAVFSVSARRNGAIDTRDKGYKAITGDIGRGIIADAKARGTRVELVFTSFGGTKNGIFFGRVPPPAPSPIPSSSPAVGAIPSPSPGPPLVAPWHRTVDELVSLAVDLGVDGINVDVEQLDDLDRGAYGEFLGALGGALRSRQPGATLTVATEASLRGAGKAATAFAAGVDRVFLMGYDYHWSGSQPGASAPVDRTDGVPTLRWSIAQYVTAGVPRDRIVLGLPLYGMTWRTVGPDRRDDVVGRGSTWILNHHADVLLDPGFAPARDPLEVVEWFVRPDGDAWRMTYYDSPATLRAKLALARDQGLAGGGFWAIGYERGLPGYVELMRDFRDGRVVREEAPPVPAALASPPVPSGAPGPGAPTAPAGPTTPSVP